MLTRCTKILAGSLCIVGLSLVSFSAWAQQASVMVVGDSISAGSDRPSYRMPLYNTLLSQQCQVDMVGDQTKTTFNWRSPSPSSTGYNFPSFDPVQYPGYPAGAHWDPAQGDDTDHQAFPSLSTNHFRDGTSGPSYTISPIGVYVNQFQPGYVLVHLGTNDMNDEITFGGMRSASQINAWADVTINEMLSVLDGIFSNHNDPGNLKVFLANLIPFGKIYTTLPDNVAASMTATAASAVFTTRLENLVANATDARLVLVDVASGFDNNTMTYDGIHPNRAGEVHMANRFVASLTAAGLCNPPGMSATPTIASPAPGATLLGNQQTFSWSKNDTTGIIDWLLELGTLENSAEYFSYNAPNGNMLSIPVTGLPTDGSQVIARLSWKTPAGWFGDSFLYNAKVSGSCGPSYSLPFGQWRMISLPCKPPAGQATVAAVLGDDIPGTYGVVWKVFGFDPQQGAKGAYVDMGTSGVLEVGKGYWIQQFKSGGGAVTLDLPSGSVPWPVSVAQGQAGCTSILGCVPISPETRGSAPTFNLLGNPFPGFSSIDSWRVHSTQTSSPNDCSVAAGCNLTQANASLLFFTDLTTYNGATYVTNSATGTLSAWDGFWAAARENAQANGASLVMAK